VGWLVIVLATGCATFDGARLYGQGTDALNRGDVASAIRDLEAAADLVPDASEIQNHLGLAYAAAERTEEARGAFMRAVDLDCTNDAAKQNLVWLESQWPVDARAAQTPIPAPSHAGSATEGPSGPPEEAGDPIPGT